MTKLEKSMLVNELVRTDINSSIKSSKRKSMNQKSKIILWILNSAIFIAFISLVIYESSLK